MFSNVYSLSTVLVISVSTRFSIVLFVSFGLSVIFGNFLPFISFLFLKSTVGFVYSLSSCAFSRFFDRSKLFYRSFLPFVSVFYLPVARVVLDSSLNSVCMLVGLESILKLEKLLLSFSRYCISIRSFTPC